MLCRTSGASQLPPLLRPSQSVCQLGILHACCLSGPIRADPVSTPLPAAMVSRAGVCRLTCPWPELAAYAASMDLASMDDVTHRHIPYGGSCLAKTCHARRLALCVNKAVLLPVRGPRRWQHRLCLTRSAGCAAVLLIKAIERWRGEQGGSLPSSSKDKAAFRQLLQSWQRTIDGFPVEVSTLLFTAFKCHGMSGPLSTSNVSHCAASAGHRKVNSCDQQTRGL